MPKRHRVIDLHEPREVVRLAEQRDRIFDVVQPRRAGQRVGAEQLVSYLAFFDADLRHGAQRCGPAPGIVEAQAKLRRCWTPDG